jgi:hypothetical protein
MPNGRALGPGGQRLNDLDAAVRREVMALADGVDPQVLDHLQRQWREQGLLPPADAAEMLAAYAREPQDRGMPTGALQVEARRGPRVKRRSAIRPRPQSCEGIGCTVAHPVVAVRAWNVTHSSILVLRPGLLPADCPHRGRRVRSAICSSAGPDARVAS